MQIPILNGIYTDNDSDFRTSYPRNMIPVPKAQGMSAGYLRPADGIVADMSVGTPLTTFFRANTALCIFVII